MDIGADLTTAGAGGKMVFVKVRETYDLETVPNKMTVIGIHTPKPDIIKANFPGLLLQCKAYRPYSCDVRVACASTQPLDPLGVGTEEGAISPEDLFNPILYKAMSNVGMSQIEARITSLAHNPYTGGQDVDGQSGVVDVDSVTTATDEFPIYYGLLSNAHGWKTADPQQGLVMTGLKPLVYEMLYNVGDNSANYSSYENQNYGTPAADGTGSTGYAYAIRGNSKPLPFINCTGYAANGQIPGFVTGGATNATPYNQETAVPYINCVCGCIIIPPSRLHTLFFRMIIEWTLEFTAVRPLSEVTNWDGLGRIADITHYQNYSYASTKKALTGSDETVLDQDQCMVSSNVEIKKVM